MNNKNLTFTNYIKSKNSSKKSYIKLLKRFDKIFNIVKKDIGNTKKTLNILNKNFKFNFRINDLNKFKKFKNIAIIGMGGSILGTEAIYNFFESQIEKKVYFFNDLSENNIIKFKKNTKLSKTLFIVVSKSGNTIETLSNSFALKIFKKNAKNIIIISEKKNNFLFSLSEKMNLFYIEHNSHVGGRYSVLSEVGIVPAYLMGINLNKLRSQTLECLKEKNKFFLKRSVIDLVQLINSRKKNNLIFLNYSPKLKKFLYWCQQLIAESLGKNNKGFMPIISNAPKDHHSLLQLYLDGPRDKIFHIFSYEKKYKETLRISKNISSKIFLNKKNLSNIKNAQKNALIKSFKQEKILFRESKIKTLKEETLGSLFSYFILETVIVGKMLNINPFDQPAVEKVKIYTKKLLR